METTEINFQRNKLALFLPESFKGLSKRYLLDCIFNDRIQQKWKPMVGDIIVGPTGNIFVISGSHELGDGNALFFFGGGLCSRDGGMVLDKTYCEIMTLNGTCPMDIDGISKYNNNSHSSIKNYKFIPYPHENDRI